MEGPLFQHAMPFRPIPVYGQRLQPGSVRVAAPEESHYPVKSVSDNLTLAKHLNLISQVGHMRALSDYQFGQLGQLRNISSSHLLHGVNKFGVKSSSTGAEIEQSHAFVARKALTTDSTAFIEKANFKHKEGELPIQQALRLSDNKQGNGLIDRMTVPVIVSCSNPFTSQYGYGRKVFPCPQCRYTTDRRNNLKRHMLTMHQTCSKTLECCGIMFATKASLREHAMIFHYHGYTCFYCGRRFCRKALLKRHLSVHNGQKDFVCPVCDYATSHKSNLERHRKVHCRPDDKTGSEDMSYEMEPEPGEQGSSSWTLQHNSKDSINKHDISDDSEDEEINVESD